jgi:hypothetical protein
VSVLLALLVLTPPSAVDARPIPTPCWLLPLLYTCEPSQVLVPQATSTVSTDQGAVSFMGDTDQGTAMEASTAQLPDGGSGP